MVKSKRDISELILKERKFKYVNEAMEEVIVRMGESDKISIICDQNKCININFLDVKDALSILYKDRKYINRYLN